jgi:hypothetical protein
MTGATRDENRFMTRNGLQNHFSLVVIAFRHLYQNIRIRKSEKEENIKVGEVTCKPSLTNPSVVL